MSPRALARQTSIGRIGFGIGFVLAPSLTGRMWIGPDASRPGTKLFIRALGARDFALGLGTLLAMRHDRPTRGWLEASGLADFADFVVTLMAGDEVPAASRARGHASPRPPPACAGWPARAGALGLGRAR